jgi:hypothetical protein
MSEPKPILDLMKMEEQDREDVAWRLHLCLITEESSHGNIFFGQPAGERSLFTRDEGGSVHRTVAERLGLNPDELSRIRVLALDRTTYSDIVRINDYPIQIKFSDFTSERYIKPRNFTVEANKDGRPKGTRVDIRRYPNKPREYPLPQEYVPLLKPEEIADITASEEAPLSSRLIIGEIPTSNAPFNNQGFGDLACVYLWNREQRSLDLRGITSSPSAKGTSFWNRRDYLPPQDSPESIVKFDHPLGSFAIPNHISEAEWLKNVLFPPSYPTLDHKSGAPIRYRKNHNYLGLRALDDQWEQDFQDD